jgi:hypothetical protein
MLRIEAVSSCGGKNRKLCYYKSVLLKTPSRV